MPRIWIINLPVLCDDMKLNHNNGPGVKKLIVFCHLNKL